MDKKFTQRMPDKKSAPVNTWGCNSCFAMAATRPLSAALRFLSGAGCVVQQVTLKGSEPMVRIKPPPQVNLLGKVTQRCKGGITYGSSNISKCHVYWEMEKENS